MDKGFGLAVQFGNLFWFFKWPLSRQNFIVPLSLGASAGSSEAVPVTSPLQSPLMWVMHLLTDLATPHQFLYTPPVLFHWGMVREYCLPWKVDFFGEILSKWSKSGFHPKCPQAQRREKPWSHQQSHMWRSRSPSLALQLAHTAVSVNAPLCILQVTSSGTLLLHTAPRLLIHTSGPLLNSFMPHSASSLAWSYKCL